MDIGGGCGVVAGRILVPKKGLEELDLSHSM
jgi:hypothetical protein